MSVSILFTELFLYMLSNQYLLKTRKLNSLNDHFCMSGTTAPITSYVLSQFTNPLRVKKMHRRKATFGKQFLQNSKIITILLFWRAGEAGHFFKLVANRARLKTKMLLSWN